LFVIFEERIIFMFKFYIIAKEYIYSKNGFYLK